MHKAISNQPNLLTFASFASSFCLTVNLCLHCKNEKYILYPFHSQSETLGDMYGLLTKVRWLDIGQVPFLRVYGPRPRSINTQKRE